MANPRTTKVVAKRDAQPVETGLTVIDSGKEMIELLQGELKNLKTIAETPFKTDGKIPQVCNIRDEKNLATLISAAASILIREKSYHEGAVAIGAGDEYPAFTIDGKLAEDLLFDIKLRYQMVTQEVRRTELEDLLKEGETFLTLTDRKAMFMEKVAKKLTK
jgi:hypothetical protein